MVTQNDGITLRYFIAKSPIYDILLISLKKNTKILPTPEKEKWIKTVKVYAKFSDYVINEQTYVNGTIASGYNTNDIQILLYYRNLLS